MKIFLFFSQKRGFLHSNLVKDSDKNYLYLFIAVGIPTTDAATT